MRVAIVTESFPPDVNGVANSVARIVDHLVDRGHEPRVIAPTPRSGLARTTGAVRAEVVRVPAISMPGYPGVRLALPGRGVGAAIAAHRPDVVHLASPMVLGAWALPEAGRLDAPVVAVYQTDIPGYARAYGVGFAATPAWRWIRHLHRRAARTLAPSRAAAEALVAHGVERIRLWRRGVDTHQFHPAHRSERLRRALAPGGELVVGYVGRLAAEKRVDLLAEASLLPGVRLVVVGDGPAGPALRRALPRAIFLGARYGQQLARVYASLDIFVHTGPYETFCQTIQEALASGVPVVAPAAGGPLDLVEPGINGMLVPPLQGSPLAAAVATLADDADLRRRLGRQARSGVADRTWPAVVDELIGHYRDVSGATVRSGGGRTRTAIPPGRPTLPITSR